MQAVVTALKARNFPVGKLPEGNEDNQRVLVLTSTYSVANYTLETTLS
jgi:hypothetical protein